MEPAEHTVGGEGLGSIKHQADTLTGRDKMRSADELPVVGHQAAFETKSPGSCLPTIRERLYS